MDIREFTTYSDHSPVTGYGVWIVLEEGKNRTQLLHPFLFTELIVTEYEFKSGSGGTLWPSNSTGVPFNAVRFMQMFKDKIEFFLENGRPFPMALVAKALAGFEDITIEEAMSVIAKLSINEIGESISRASNKANRIYQIREGKDISNFNGRPFTLLKAIKENGPASIYQITSLVEGKLQTKSDLSRVVTYFVNKLTSQGILEIMA